MRTAQRVLVRFVAPAATALLATLGSGPVASATPARTSAGVCDNICFDGVRAATHDGYDRVVFDPYVRASKSDRCLVMMWPGLAR
ncbi:hypothetical protein OG206_05950 [Streptomyces sp. NBC_01341]|uniref:hypothetical protein n=1 Tax=Streptomyces sp. NBC_01341 TaxID=2903831 RepID=UPI002E0E5852|nr:hypothetical protein OG206_05950 [Streptomyces sp. NBC_01341]